MAVAFVRVPDGVYGPIEPVTLVVLCEEIAKLHGTVSDDLAMEFSACVRHLDTFVDELGQCINLSIARYPELEDRYAEVFNDLQDVINLMHGDQPGLMGSDGRPRLMDDGESRSATRDKLSEIMEKIPAWESEIRTIENEANKKRGTSKGNLS